MLTKQDVLDIVLSPRFNKRRKNPVDPTTEICLYTHPKTGKHCAVGEIFAIANLYELLPPIDHQEYSVDELDFIEDHVEQDAIRLLSDLQMAADGKHDGGPRTWGDALRKIHVLPPLKGGK